MIVLLISTTPFDNYLYSHLKARQREKDYSSSRYLLFISIYLPLLIRFLCENLFIFFCFFFFLYFFVLFNSRAQGSCDDNYDDETKEIYDDHSEENNNKKF